MTCNQCKYWGTDEAWIQKPDWNWNLAHECKNTHLKAASQHAGGPNYDGPITTMPDFGCIQFEQK